MTHFKTVCAYSGKKTDANIFPGEQFVGETEQISEYSQGLFCPHAWAT